MRTRCVDVWRYVENEKHGNGGEEKEDRKRDGVVSF
jgi:hypothetical protein